MSALEGRPKSKKGAAMDEMIKYVRTLHDPEQARLVLTCTAHGKPVWTFCEADDVEDALFDRDVDNPPPYRVMGWTHPDLVFVSLDEPHTWFPDPEWIEAYLTW